MLTQAASPSCTSARPIRAAVSASGAVQRTTIISAMFRAPARCASALTHLQRCVIPQHLMLLVQKFGGTSVGTVDRIRNVARRCIATQRKGHQVVVIVSAMAGETNRLLALAKQMCDDPSDRELDVIAATGEQVSVGLLALALHGMGAQGTSFLGHPVRVTTDSAFIRARIKSIDETKIRECLEKGRIAVVAGFQGIDDDGNITTLGRGGSDTSAVAIAAALRADSCEIYTDVDGVYTADPGICP